MLRTLTIAAILLLTACDAMQSSTGQDANGSAWRECTTTLCAAERLSEAYRTNRKAVRAELATLGELEQLVALEILVDRFSGDTAAICAALPQSGRVGERCERWRNRPHLTVRPMYAERNPTRKRVAPGPHNGLLPLPDVAAITPAADAVLPSDCEPGWACVNQAARLALWRGTPADGVGICAVGQPANSKEYSECVFELAEALAKMNGMAGLHDALGLCVASGWAKACFHHALSLSLPPAAAADAPGEEQLASIRTASEQVRRIVGPDHADRYEDYLWSIWTLAAFRSVNEVSGDLIDHLPPRAAPHVVQAAAYRLVVQEPGRLNKGLDALAEDLLTALKKRNPSTPPGEAVAIDLFKPGQQFWQRDLGEAEGAIASTYCMGASRRALASDQLVDAKLALLEATGVMRRMPDNTFYASLVGSEEDELIRWTAARILTHAWPHTDWSAELQDPSALVQERLSRRR